MRVTKLVGCACSVTKRKRKKRGSADYLAWLDQEVPSLARSVRKFFKAAAKDIAKDLSGALPASKVQKAKGDIDRVMRSLNFDRWTALVGIFEDALAEAFKDNARAGFQAIGFDPSDDILHLVNDNAVAWSKKHAADLVGMHKTKDGEWVESTKGYAITKTTRDDLRSLVEEALEEGWSADQLAGEIEDAHAFSDTRSETIARTELAFAHVEGNLDSWRESGVVSKKESILGSEHDLDDVCNENAEAGPIDLEAEFPSGHQGPPYHPNCVCDVIPVLAD